MKVQNISGTVVDIQDGALSPAEIGEDTAAHARPLIDSGVLAEVEEAKKDKKDS